MAEAVVVGFGTDRSGWIWSVDGTAEILRFAQDDNAFDPD
jgi:hypothetical protein